MSEPRSALVGVVPVERLDEVRTGPPADDVAGVRGPLALQGELRDLVVGAVDVVGAVAPALAVASAAPTDRVIR